MAEITIQELGERLLRKQGIERSIAGWFVCVDSCPSWDWYISTANSFSTSEEAALAWLKARFK